MATPPAVPMSVAILQKLVLRALFGYVPGAPGNRAYGGNHMISWPFGVPKPWLPVSVVKRMPSGVKAQPNGSPKLLYVAVSLPTCLPLAANTPQPGGGIGLPVHSSAPERT